MTSNSATHPLLPLSLSVLLASAVAVAAPKKGSFAYPKPPLSDQVDDYHGTKVPDPYRRLENPDAPETRAWIETENKITSAFLEGIPERAALRERLTKLWNFERYSAPYKEGGRYFYTKNDGLQNQAVLYVMEKLGDKPRVLLDPNGLSVDGTVALAGQSVSRDGRLLAYAIAAAGSDWHEWHVRDVETGKDLPDVLKWIKFSSIAWTPDAKGFYYSRFDEPAKGRELDAVNKNQKLFYHRLETAQSEDALVYARPDEPEFEFAALVTDDGKYLVVTVYKGTDRRNRLYFRELASDKSDFVRVFDDFDAGYSFVDNIGSTFYIRTDLDAPRGRVVSIDVAALPPAGVKKTLKEVVPQSDATLQFVNVLADRLVVGILKDATERVRIHKFDGSLEKEIELPTLGSVGGLVGKRTDHETFYSFTSFTYPTAIYRYDFETGKSELFRQPKVDFDPAAYETKQVFFPSKDGTKIPLFLVHKKGIKLDGKNPTYLYGYGGFNIPLTPGFSVRNLAWMERGGVYAQACLRGGSEYGEDWHRAGMLDKKQNVFDDFAAAAKWLIEHKVASPATLSIGGGSNGGLLVGATLNQHPELFGAAVPAVGVMDMLRFHKFTIGWGWVSDYGSSDDPAAFKYLYAYSPLHNVKNGAKYPPVLVITGDHDDRVVPAHSFKYAATLQAAQGGDAPILIRIETRAGHGAGKPTKMQIEEAADVLAFLSKCLGAGTTKQATPSP